MRIEELTSLVIGICIKVHSKIGPGCFERVYEEILYYELNKLGLIVERQVLLPIQWEDLHIENAYKIDLMIENRLILEIKSIFPLAPVFFNQIHTYLSLLQLKHGLLLNFKVPLMRDGIYRVYNNSGRESNEPNL